MTYTSKVSNSELDFMNAWAAFLTKSQVETDKQAGWTQRISKDAPFSFKFGDKDSSDVLCKMTWEHCAEDWKGNVRTHNITGTDASTGLVIGIDFIQYRDYPAVEWVLHFTNTSSTDLPAISQLCAVDMKWTKQGTVPVLHYSRGSDERPDDFEYISEPLKQLRMPSKTIHLNSGAGNTPIKSAMDGRSSVDWLPFFNLQTGEEGMMVAIGWTGQWAADFIHDGEGNTQIKGGMEFMNLQLAPGETIRTPRTLLMYWQGELIHSQNMLRQFILAYHTPHIDGKPAVAPFSMGSWGGSVTAEHMELIGKVKKYDLPYDYYWIDAGWYGTGQEPCPDVFHGDWGITGDWRVNRYRHPDGLNPIVDAAKEAGMKFLLWIEPLRATYKTPVTIEHPEWFLSLTGNPPEPNESLLLNLGNPDACQWAIETVSGLIDEIGIDCYREDYNFFGSQQCFLRNDPPGRQGITEIRFVEGLYKFWDELLRRHPNLLIDNCASGGRRIDLETISRSIALWRTDYTCFAPVNPNAIQVHTCGLANWVPLNGTSPVAEPFDTYSFRSALSAAMQFAIDEFGLLKQRQNNIEAWNWHRKMMLDFLRVRPYWYGDYYPLMCCSLAADTWMAYQLHCSDVEEGTLVAFRREKSPLTTAVFEMKGLAAGSVYEFTDADSDDVFQLTTGESETANFTVEIATPRTARLLFYRKIS